MRLIPISDLHLDFTRASKHSDKHPILFSAKGIKNFFEPILNEDDTNVICVCGDLAERGKGVVWCLRASIALNELAYTHIVYVPGNHEFYGGNVDNIIDDFTEINKTSAENVHILDGVTCASVQIYDVTFIGGTLWTSYKNGEAITAAKKGMNDFKAITVGVDNKPLSPNRILNEHYTQRKVIFKTLDRCPTEKRVCLSHHQPFTDDVVTDMLHYAYCEDLSEALEACTKPPQFWFSGHTHKAVYKEKQFSNGIVTFVSNPIGYGMETKTGYNKQCYFDI